MKSIPELKDDGAGFVLYSDGKPFLALGGEVHNSSASDLNYMREVVWPAVKRLGGNFLLVPVYWECLEPEEGVFDFTLVDELLHQAEENGYKLGLLWFGLWKSMGSDYMPLWLKRDRSRYFLQRDGEGAPTQMVSPFCQEALALDRRAYVRLMEHLRDYDTQRTVLLIQVENEPGVWFYERDFSDASQETYAREIPSEVAEMYGVSGAWEEAFGEKAPARFMSWAYSRALEQLASAGKQVYPLPTFTNCVPSEEGFVVSGTCTPGNFAMWRRFCPSLDVYAPNAYGPRFDAIAQLFDTPENPLWVPETDNSAAAAAKLIYALGACNLGMFSPFGVEEYYAPLSDCDHANMGTSPNPQRDGEALRQAYQLALALWPQIRLARQEGRLAGYFLEESDFAGKTTQLDGMVVKVETSKQGTGGALLLRTGVKEYLFFGVNVVVSFYAHRGDRAPLTVWDKRELLLKDGCLKEGRILNGDQRRRTAVGKMPALLKLRLNE